MANSYRPVDRDQAFLLPVSLREWLPQDDLVWFLLDTVEALDTSAFHARRVRSGRGRAAFNPEMLLALMIYAYANQVHSSRQIERSCTVDVAFRVICAQDGPDHSTIARFRRDHEAAFTALFEQVLILCAKAGLGRVGVIAVDGTKIAANASLDANRTEQSLRSEVERIMAAAAQTDAEEDDLFGQARGDELPAAMASPAGRVTRLRECLDQIAAENTAAIIEQAATDARAVVKVQAARTRTERAEKAATDQAQSYQAQWDQSAQRPPGRPPAPVDDSSRVKAARQAQAATEQWFRDRTTSTSARDQAAAKTPSGKAPRRNPTDPDSRIMPTRKGWIQGYNAQLAVTDDHLIIATHLTQDTVDLHQHDPMIAATSTAIAILEAHQPAASADQRPRIMLFDAGYLTNENLTADGPDRLIALGKHRDQTDQARRNPATGEPPDTATPIQKMSHRLRTPEGNQTYKRRGAIVEPVIGHLKDRTGLRTFSRRGLNATTSELNLAAATANLVKLHRTRTT